jgi:hypothetical protein
MTLDLFIEKTPNPQNLERTLFSVHSSTFSLEEGLRIPESVGSVLSKLIEQLLSTFSAPFQAPVLGLKPFITTGTLVKLGDATQDSHYKCIACLENFSLLTYQCILENFLSLHNVVFTFNRLVIVT